MVQGKIRTILVVVSIAWLAVLWAPAARAADGKEVFLAQKCNLCHSVQAADIEAKTRSEKLYGGDLSEVANRHEPEWIAQYVTHKVQKDGEDHKKEFTGTDEELKALIGWLKDLAAAAADNKKEG